MNGLRENATRPTTILAALTAAIFAAAAANAKEFHSSSPVGTTQCRAIGDISASQVMRTILPFHGALIAALVLATYVPVFSLGLPQLFLVGKL